MAELLSQGLSRSRLNSDLRRCHPFSHVGVPGERSRGFCVIQLIRNVLHLARTVRPRLFGAFNIKDLTTSLDDGSLLIIVDLFLGAIFFA